MLRLSYHKGNIFFRSAGWKGSKSSIEDVAGAYTSLRPISYCGILRGLGAALAVRTVVERIMRPKGLLGWPTNSEPRQLEALRTSISYWPLLLVGVSVRW